MSVPLSPNRAVFSIWEFVAYIKLNFGRLRCQSSSWRATDMCGNEQALYACSHTYRLCPCYFVCEISEMCELCETWDRGMSMDPAVLQELFSKRARRTEGTKSRSSVLHQSECTDLSSLHTSVLALSFQSVMSTDVYPFQPSCPCPYMVLPECDQSYVDRIRHLKHFHLNNISNTRSGDSRV